MKSPRQILCALALCLCALFATTGCATRASLPPAPPKGYAYMPKGGWGKFSGPIDTRWLEQGRKMQLLDEVKYTDGTGRAWDAPKGWVIDGASIPRQLWSIIGGPFDGQYRDASVFHDVGCDQKTARWQDVHLMFYHAMRASGVPQSKAKTMFTAVWYFGPHWQEPTVLNKILPIPPASKPVPQPTAADLRAVKKWVQTENPSTDQLLDPQEAAKKVPTLRAQLPAPKP